MVAGIVVGSDKGIFGVADLGLHGGRFVQLVIKSLVLDNELDEVYGMIPMREMEVMDEYDMDDEEARDVLHYIDENKTGALIESSLMIGAIIGGASAEQVAKIEKMGSNVGIAFQIQDDILDIEGDAAELGKPIGSDIKNEKTTYVSLYGMEDAKKKVKELSDEAKDILQSFGQKDTFLEGLFEYLIYRKK